MSFNASFSVQQPTAQKFYPGSLGRPREQPLHIRASHRYYMHFADACNSSHSPLAAATGFVAPWICPPSAPPSSLPPHLHRHIFKVFSIPGGEYNIHQGVVQCSTAYNLTTLPSSLRWCDDSGSDSPIHVRYTDTAYDSLMLLVQSTRRQPAFQHPEASPPRRLPRRPHTSMCAFLRPLAYLEVSTVSNRLH